MASFQVKRRDTGIIYNIKVSEFVFRNTFGINKENGLVTSLESTGYTSVTTIGDNISQKLGIDALIQGAEFEFTNNPNYYLKAEKLYTYSIRRFEDPTADDAPPLPVKRTIQYDVQLYNLNIYSGNNVYKGRFIYFLDMQTKDFQTGENITVTTIPNFTAQPFEEGAYRGTFGFNFSQKQLSMISPYIYKIQSFSRPDLPFRYDSRYEQSYGNATPIYINTSFTVRNRPLSGTANGLYFKNSNTFKSVTDITNYSDIANQTVEACVSSQSPVSTSYSPTSIFNLFTGGNGYKIDGMNPYDFYYSLLFDTLSEDNPYPDNPPQDNPSGQSPPITGGNPTGGDTTSDDIGVPPYPTVNPISTGSVNLYEMSGETFRSFMSYLWTNTFFTAFIKLFQDPMQAIISSHIIGIAVPTVRHEPITIGNVTTTVEANVVGNNFVTANFNYVEIPEFYKDSSDYIETVVELYIPYYGYVTLNTYEVMGAKVYLQYTIDVLTGAFVAFVTVQKTTDGTNLNSVMYQYNGNMAYQIPLSSVDYSSFVTATLGAIGALTQKRIGSVVGGLVDSALSVEVGYDRASTLTANTGYMSVKQAYVTILRPIHNLAPNFKHYVGYPYEGYVNLGSCSGLTICREVYVDNVIGTIDETEEIKRLLMEGVIF